MAIVFQVDLQECSEGVSSVSIHNDDISDGVDFFVIATTMSLCSARTCILCDGKTGITNVLVMCSTYNSEVGCVMHAAIKTTYQLLGPRPSTLACLKIVSTVPLCCRLLPKGGVNMSCR